ncbi:MAG: lasso peptide [Hassallia sp.]
MKKQYSIPTLTNHGSVEAITEFFGDNGRTDFLFFNGSQTSNADGPITSRGSIDGDLILNPNDPTNPTITPR